MDFLDEDGFGTWMAGAVDDHLSPVASVRHLVQGTEEVFPEDIPAGTRVAFEGSLSALLSYPYPPELGATGTVVTVKTAVGNATSHEGMVFVKWDDGRFLGIHRAHLTPGPSTEKTASLANYRRVIASLGDLDEFLRVASAGSDLVHKATRDLWSLKVSDGEYVIERLFDETGKPLKV